MIYFPNKTYEKLAIEDKDLSNYEENEENNGILIHDTANVSDFESNQFNNTQMGRNLLRKSTIYSRPSKRM